MFSPAAGPKALVAAERALLALISSLDAWAGPLKVFHRTQIPMAVNSLCPVRLLLSHLWLLLWFLSSLAAGAVQLMAHTAWILDAISV
jgi:hypothetical protein